MRATVRSRDTPASPAHAGMYPAPGPSSARRDRFPRTRGDVPPSAPGDGRRDPLPPHTRGCTRWEYHHLPGGGASPAHAGMYLMGLGRGSVKRGFPRTRGDVPGAHSGHKAASALPPHTRGCTRPAQGRAHRRWASPAHAGMYRRRPGRRWSGTSFPRTRGDVPSRRRAAWRGWPLPPHTRGCTPEAEPETPETLASPAHAGMYPSTPCDSPFATRFPRTRGDVPRPSLRARPTMSLPPHTRGCTFRPLCAPAPADASPAHAGMYPQSPRWTRPI